MTSFPQSLVEAAPPDLPDELREYLPQAQSNAYGNVRVVVERHGAGLERLHKRMDQVTRARSSTKAKVFEIREVARQWSPLYVAESACKTGCSHCCHLPTTIPRTEAQLIADAIGRPLHEPSAPMALGETGAPSARYGYDNPCTFLVAGRCAIYAHRPLVCRTLVNMDNDARLCELRQDTTVPVPYADSVFIQGRLAMVCANEVFADIRDWFPSLPAD